MAYAVFTKKDAQRIARVVREAEVRASDWASGRPSRRHRRRDVIKIINRAPMTIPQYGIVRIHTDVTADVVYYGTGNWDAAGGPFYARRPIHGGHERIAIACADIPAGETGSAWVSGDHPALIYSNSALGPVGYRCFCWPNTFAAHYFLPGPGGGVPNVGPIWCLSHISDLVGAYIRVYRVRLRDWRP